MSNTKNAKVKLNLKSFTTDELVNFAKHLHVTNFDNKNFAGAEKLLEELSAATKETEASLADYSTAKTNCVKAANNLEENETKLETVIKKVASFAECIAGGDVSLLEAAGLTARAVGSRNSIALTPPENLQAKVKGENEITLAWNKVKGARSYIIEMSKDAEGSDGWKQAGIAVTSKAIIQNLGKLSKYWFRVSAIGVAGQSSWSTPCPGIIA